MDAQPQPKCGVPTPEGRFPTCQGAAPCDFHLGKSGQKQAPRSARVTSVAPERLAERAVQPASALAARDLRGVAWWWLECLCSEAEPAKAAGAAASIIRVLSALGEAPIARERAFAEAELLGSLMSGIPPRGEEDEALAEEMLGADALERMARWPLAEVFLSR